MPTLLFLLAVALPTGAGDTLVVCPAEFQSALAPWIAYRSSAGHGIEVISAELSAVELRQAIRRRARQGVLEYVVLVGDAAPPDVTLLTSRALSPAAPVEKRAGAARARTVPVWRAEARINPRYGGGSTIATDNAYADLDDDGRPELAIGRLTADSPAELARMVQKILAYERSADFGPWRRQVNLLAGTGGFGPLADGAIEAAARRVIAAGIPPAYATRITYGNWRSPYCPDPCRFRQSTVESLSEGSLCWVYVGHAGHRSLAGLEVPGGLYAGLDIADLEQLRGRHAAPIACLLACHTGAFDAPEDCLAEGMLAAPGGPVAVICGSQVTMPYSMAVLGTELLAEIFERRPATIGRALLAAKRQMVAPGERSELRSALDALAALFNPEAAEEELAEHLNLFNLLGDPLLTLKMPEPLAVRCPRRVPAGGQLAIEVVTPVAGRATVELVPRRDVLGFRPPVRAVYTGLEQQSAEFAATYRRANDPCLARCELDAEQGAQTTALLVPDQVRGTCEVRVFIAGSRASAAGSASIDVETSAPAGAKAARSALRTTPSPAADEVQAGGTQRE